MGTERSSDRTGGVIGVDVVGIPFGVDSDRREDRNKVTLKKRIDQGDVNLFDLTNKAKIAPLFIFLLFTEKGSPVFTADPHRFDAHLLKVVDQRLSDRTGENHLGNRGGLLIGYPQSVDEDTLFTEAR